MKVILDVDTGIDDALALMQAVLWERTELKAVMCVAGNVGVDQVYANTKYILEAINAPSIPVGKGAVRPLIEAHKEASHIHGVSGLGARQIPVDSLELNINAIEILKKTILEHPNEIVLVALGPLTNIALFVRTYPEVASKVQQIVVMGGAIESGNATAVAEFNFWHDPEAAEIVLTSGLNIRLFPLDVFNQSRVSEEFMSHLESISTHASKIAHELLQFASMDEQANPFGMLGDAAALICGLAPEFTQDERMSTSINLSPGLGRGQSIFDRRTHIGEDQIHGELAEWQEIEVITSIDFEKVAKLFIETMRKGS